MKIIRKTALIAMILLAGCKADRVIVEVEQRQIEEAIAGAAADAEFEATFDFSGELDSDKRAELVEIEKLVRREMDIVDFLVTGDGSETQVEIQGYLPVSSDLATSAVWFIGVEPFGEGRFIVSVKTGGNYSRLFDSIRKVNSSFAPDEFHPTTIRYRGDGAEITVPAGYVDGQPRVMWTSEVDGRISMRFADGIFDDVGGAFIYKQ